MTIAVVLNENNVITPIVEGTVLRIINDDLSYQDYRNPALDLTEGRRGATLRKAIEQGASVFVAPPETFCDFSYKKAQEEQVVFYNIESNQTYKQFETALKEGKVEISKHLPVEEVVPSVPVSN